MVLHPLVLLSVVDHYNRVARDTKKRVVGVLLGDVHKGVVDVSNSFARKAALTLSAHRFHAMTFFMAVCIPVLLLLSCRFSCTCN